MTQGGGPQGKSCCESPSHGRSLLVDGWHLVGVEIWEGGLKLMAIRQVGLLGGPSDFWEEMVLEDKLHAQSCGSG